MAKKPKSNPPPPDALALGLEGLRAPPEDLGLSLDELSQAYASLLGAGDDPFAPAPEVADGLEETRGDEIVLQGLFAAAQQLPASPTADETDDSADSAGLEEEDDDDEDDGDPAQGTSTGTSPSARRGELRAGPMQAPPATALQPASRSATTRPGGGSGWGEPRRDRCEISPRTILEAMLFVGHPANEPLTAKQVASLMRGVLPREIDDLVRELNDAYDADGMPYRIESDGAGYRLALRSEFGNLREKFLGRVREVRLVPAAVDVLAIIAYSQPIGRDEIDKLRNKSSGAILNQLVRRGILRVEFADERARKPLYYTTDRFLELFNLRSLDDLPRSQEIERSFS